MRLHDYFDTVKSYKLSDKEKNALYERVLRQSQYQKPIFSRARFYIKVAGYMTFLGLLGLSIYVPFLGQRDNNDGSITNIAKAGYIAKVINVQGDYYIESDGQRLEGNNINDGDRVVLTEGSSLIVHVGDTVEGKLSGPATFVVNRSEKGYNITLKDGNYVEFTTLGDQNTSPEVALISENHKFTARTQAGKGFHFVLTEENDKPLLVNKDNDDIQITNEDSPNKTIFLAENKSVAVGTYIFATTAAPSEVAKVVARISPTSDSEEKIGDGYDDSFFRGMLLSSQSARSQENATMKVANAEAPAATIIIASDTTAKEVPIYDPIEVRSNLIPQFVWVDIKYVTYYYLNGQEQEYHVAYENFLKRLYNLYDALKINIPSEGVMASQKDAYSLYKLRILAEHIQANIPSQIPDHQVKTLNTLVLFLQKLSTQSFGEYKGNGLTLEQMFEKIQ